MSRIAHPHFQPGRSKGLAGIEFIDGFAEVDLPGDGILRQAFVQHGYSIEEAAVAVRPSKVSKRSGKGKDAEAAKASEPSNDAATEGDFEGVAEDGTIPVQMMIHGEEVEIGRVQVRLTDADLAKLTESPEV